jgi:hypothetical protein
VPGERSTIINSGPFTEPGFHMRPNHVSIRRNFCPLCYKGCAVVHAHTPRGSPCIDEDQAQYSKLPLLDLQAEGERCAVPCRLTCLVCGNAMALGCEQEFEEALDALDQYEEESEETRIEVVEGMKCLGILGQKMLADLERRFAGRLRRLGMAMLPRWRRLAHLHCVKKAPCDCLLPVGASMCRTHKRSTPKPRQIRLLRQPEPMPSLPVPTPKTDPQTSCVQAVCVSKATWLGKPAQDAVRVPVKALPRPPLRRPAPAKPNSQLEQAAAGCARLGLAGKLEPAVLSQKPTTIASNPGKKRDHRLEAASKISQRLDEWAGTSPAECGDSGPVKKARPAPLQYRPLLQTARPPFCRAKYESQFDPRLHGYMKKNGVDIFRFPDGYEEQVFSCVNELTPDGHLLPK